MAKRILTLCLALVIGIAFAMPAGAAVKSIKVGGDLTIRGIYRDNLDFIGTDIDKNQAWAMTATRIWVGAELTDNVSAVIRLINEKDWGNSIIQTAAGAAGIVGLPLNTSQSVDIDLAYIKMKDLFFPGFTATLGRQEILLGKGFVVGNANGLAAAATANTAIRAADLTTRKAFDAWKLDLEAGTVPLTFTLFDAKILEENASVWQTQLGLAPLFTGIDANLMGLNVAYKLDNATIEGYVLDLNARKANVDIFTYGLRVDHNVLAMPGFNYNLEAALQNGDLTAAISQNAWAGNADISYTFQNPMQPKIGGSWFYATGNKAGGTKNEGWLNLFADNLGDRVGRLTLASAAQNVISLPFLGMNNSIPKVYASIKPAEKHALSLAYFPASTVVVKPGTTSNVIGWELDFGYSYQYTEDVSFGLCVDFAEAGKMLKQAIGAGFDSNATQVIGSVAVSF
ncbi:MAG: alginate export family protein [Candidatus Omnitrophica bacterium]|nr:alginate export family protein [Candidatus Omnitrophota bacterium]